jgi:PAS domain S-box-containing protein
MTTKSNGPVDGAAIEQPTEVRETIATALKYLGAAGLEANGGISAVEITLHQQDQIRCVLCDLTMPRTNGCDSMVYLIIPPEMQGEVERALRRMAETGQPVPASELSLRRKGGSRVAVFSSHASMRIPGRAVELFCLDIDLTEQNRAEQALRLTRFSIEHASEALFWMTPDARIVDVNEAACRSLGYTREELLQLAVPEVDPHYTTEKWPQHFAELRQHGSLKFESEQRTKDGRLFPVEIVANHVQFGTEERNCAFVRDITERKRAEAEKEKLEAQNRQLQKAESLGRMAGAIAHHFNNQLQSVMMNLDFALRSQTMGEIPTENLAEAMQSAHKAAEVSSLMLTYLGQTHCTRAPLDLSETCRRHLPMLRVTLFRNVMLETNFPSPGPTISANGNQIQQVITNLVNNACEALPEQHGCIRLKVQQMLSTEIPIRHRFPINWQPQAPTYACLEVEDDGCGIAIHDIEKLCDPFFSSKFTGRGLGLPVVLGIVRGHHGVITVESQPERGSVFRVFLPVITESVPQRHEPVVQIPSFTRGDTVLLVEDEPDVRKVVTLALSRLHFTVFTAANGLEALELFRRHSDKIKLVLCDLTMPRMNGWETLTALRQLSPDIPVILSSGYSEDQTMAGHHPELPQAFLSKPYVFGELRDILAKVLGKADRKVVKTSEG